jgi:hypothetical protein
MAQGHISLSASPAPLATAGHAAPTPPGESYKTSYAVEVADACLDGLVLTPIGGRGRGPPRHGAHAEVVAAAGKPLGASFHTTLLVWR